MSNNNIRKKKKQGFLEFNNGKKKASNKLVNVIRDKVRDTTIQAIQNCSHFMRFHTDVTLEKRKLMQANSCKNRFCPMCAYRKARKDGLKHMIMTKKLKKDNKYAFIFLTLTAPSVTGERLENEINDYAAAFKRLTKLKEFQPINKGYIRKLEVTYNSKKDTYHPHYHVLICVDKNYFKDKKYIKQSKWLEMWQLAKRDNNISVVDVRRVKDSEEDNVYLEISKYTAKDSDYIYNKKTFDVFYDALKGKQVITYNSIFKELAKKYDNGELDYLKDIDETKYVYRVIYKWYQNHYEELSITELTEEEKNKLWYNNLIDEIEVADLEE